MVATPRGIGEVRAVDGPERLAGEVVSVEGVLTFVNEADFATYGFLQEGDEAVYLEFDDGLAVPSPGHRLVVRASVTPGEFAPSLQVHAVEDRGRAAWPRAAVDLAEDMVDSRLDARWVMTDGVVRSARYDPRSHLHVLRLSSDADAITAELPGAVPSEEVLGLIGDRIEVFGAAGARFNAARQLLGARVFVPDLARVRVLEEAPDRASMAVQPLSELLRYGLPTGPAGLVRVEGVVTFHSPTLLVIQDDGGAAMVRLSSGEPPPVGRRVSLVGYAEPVMLAPLIADAQMLSSEPGRLPEPLADAPLFQAETALRRVAVRGTVLDRFHRPGVSVITVSVDGRTLDALVQDPEGRLAGRHAPGSEVQLVGVVRPQADPFQPRRRPDEYAELAQDLHLLVNGPDDVSLLRSAPIWTPVRAAIAVGALLVILLLTGGIVLVLRHQVGRQTRQIREQLAEQARLRVQAQAANRAKSRFLATMSHELRTPLHGIQGTVSILRESGALSTEDRELVDLVHDSGNQLARLVGDVLDLSKAEAGQLAVERRPVQVRELLGACADEVRPLAERVGLELHVDLAEDLPSWLSIDGLRLRQVVSNLLTNAVKFTCTGSVRVRAWQDDDTLVVQVIDTGPGVPEDQREVVFEPFQQIDDRVERAHEGTGLGLAICREICGLLDGGIALHSQVGQGSTFEVRVRAPACAPPTLDDPSIPDVELDGLRVLVADDNPVNRAIVAGMLGRMGIEACVVDDGEQALERLLSDTFDLALLDLHMPHLGGIGVARQARAALGAQAPPILALTADALAETRRACVDAGMRSVLTKPVTLDGLRRAIRDVVRPPVPRARRTSVTR